MRTLGGWLLLAWAPLALAQTDGAVAGRLVFLDGDQPLTVGQAEQEVGGESISLELRSGREVHEAKLHRDGYFVLQAPPGTYRLEYLRLGDKAEFIPPQLLTIEPGALTCAGSLAVDTGSVENLGVNVESQVEVTGDCETLWPRLRKLHSAPAERVALARAGPLVEHPETPDLVERLAGITVAVGTDAVRLGYLHSLYSHPNNPFGVFLHGSGGWVYRLLIGDLLYNQVGLDLTGGAGVELLGLQFAGVVGMRQVTQIGVINGGLVLGAFGKFPLGPFGLGVRAEALPSPSWSLFIDVSPVALMGVLL